MTDIDFYFDFASPYAYFAACRIEQLAAEHGRKVVWHPVLIAALTKATGTPLAPTLPIKWEYLRRDLPRVARAENLPFRFPSGFPSLMLEPGRAMLWIGSVHGDSVAGQFARTCMQAYFGDGVDINDPEVLAGIASSFGVERGALLAGMADPAIKERFKQSSALALERGVFGVPFMLVDGEAFWGFDRLPHLAQALRQAALV